VRVVAGFAHDGDDLLNFGRIGGIAEIERYNPTAKPFAWTYAGKPLVK